MGVNGVGQLMTKYRAGGLMREVTNDWMTVRVCPVLVTNLSAGELSTRTRLDYVSISHKI